MLQKGDRIVIKATEGPCARYRGEIGTVIAVNKQRKVCVVEGMTIVRALCLFFIFGND